MQLSFRLDKRPDESYLALDRRPRSSVGQTAGGGSIPRWSASKSQVHRTMPQSINGRPNKKRKSYLALDGKKDLPSARK